MALPAQAPALSRAAPDARSFRDALGRFATGVAFVTAAPDGEPHGLIVNSLTSVSLDPPLVSFSPARSSLTWARMRTARRFGVNVLGRQHEAFARRAAPPGADRFAGLDWRPGRGGAALLTGALATLECEIVAEHPAGDHWIVVGCVDEVRISPGGDPLVFFAGAFGALQATVRPGRGSDASAGPVPRGAASRRPPPHAGEAASGIVGSIRGYSAGSGSRSLARDTATGARPASSTSSSGLAMPLAG